MDIKTFVNYMDFFDKGEEYRFLSYDLQTGREHSMLFSDFYDDIDFMIALFFFGMLNNADIYEVANRLNEKTSDDILAQIIANGTDVNNKKLFNNYLNALGIKFLDSRRAVAAKVLYYILHNRINFYTGINFVYNNVSEHENTKYIVGDDIGIEVLQQFWLIDDGDLENEKDIENVIESIIIKMKKYINEYLVNFSKNNSISKNNIKIVIEPEIENNVKIKALAEGIEIRDHCKRHDNS